MARINLLPWREELRQKRQRDFIGILVGVGLLAVGIVFMSMQFTETQLKSQKFRNGFLKKESAVLDAQISEIQELRDKKNSLLERMELIQSLQGNRPVIVRIFDELARSVPDDLYFTDLSIEGAVAKVGGRAKSNNRVATLMRNFDSSDWFSSPNLINVKAEEGGYNTFEVTMTQTDPKNRIQEVQ